MDDLAQLARGVKRLGEIELDEARLRLAGLAVKAALGCVAAVAGLALLLLLVREFVRGASAGLADAFDSPWLGQLVFGAGGLLLLALLARIFLAARARREFRRLHDKYGDHA